MYHTPGNSKSELKIKKRIENGIELLKRKLMKWGKKKTKQEEDEKDEDRIGLECAVIGLIRNAIYRYTIQHQHFLNHIVMYEERDVFIIVYFHQKVD